MTASDRAEHLERRKALPVWVRFLVRRLGAMCLILAGLVVASFLLVSLIPGDPARRVAGIDATAADIERVRASLGLNQPLAVQFTDYVVRLGQLDLGKSFVTQEPVRQVIADRLPNTARLGATAMLLVLGCSIPLGLFVGALTRDGLNRRLDLIFTAVTSSLGSLPEYLMGTFLAFIFAVWLAWLPVAGASKWNAVFLPALAIGIRPICVLSRIVRVETLNVLAQDYISTARSKRMPARLLYLRHVLPNVVTAALTVGGLLLASLMGGTVIVENVFAWPGLGTAIVQAVLVRDYPVIQGVILFLGVIVVLVNTFVDLVIGFVDPRSQIREG